MQHCPSAAKPPHPAPAKGPYVKAAAPPPLGDEQLWPKSLHRGQDEASRGGTGGGTRGALGPASCRSTDTQKVWGMGGAGRTLRTDSVSTSEVSHVPPVPVRVPPPVPSHPGGGGGEGGKPQPKALKAGLGVS